MSVDLTDQATVQNLSLVLVAPGGVDASRWCRTRPTLGTAHTGQGLPSGNAIGQFGYAPGTPGLPAIAVGTIFDDNATRNIFDPSTTGTTGIAQPTTLATSGPRGRRSPDTLTFPGSRRADTLTNFLALEMSKGNINGNWTLEITNFKSTSPAAGELNSFSLQFNTGMIVSSPSTIAGTSVVGALGDTYARASAATPTGIGPGLALAVDNTIGPNSPYQGRVYADLCWLQSYHEPCSKPRRQYRHFLGVLR